jgi:GNAT superfamily N-acetyltransferase
VALTVEPVGADDVADLRRRVLRDGEAHEGFPDDHAATTLHLGARSDGRLVGIATFALREPGVYQLRGMAVEPELQGRGIGRAVLDEAERRLRALGARQVWANGRDTALGFYERAGWRVEGDGYVVIGLPHHRVVRDLAV